MAGRMLSIKFGADTTRLEAAMKRVRKSMANMFTARGLIGGAIAGIGAAGVIGAAMNLNPRVANSILRLESHLTGAFASALYKMEPAIVRLTDTLINVADVFLSAVGEASSIYEQIGKVGEQFGQVFGNLIARVGQGDPTGVQQALVMGGLMSNQVNVRATITSARCLTMTRASTSVRPEHAAVRSREAPARGPNERRPDVD